jgi:exosortase
MVAGLGLYLLCGRLSARTPAACAAGVLVFGEVCYLWGWRAGLRLVFPLTVVTYALALQPTLVAPLGFWLQTVTATLAGSASQGLGMPVVREGLVLRSDDFAFVVAETCSGMNSLLALLGLAGVWTYLTRAPVAGRAAVVASLLPLVIVANTARVVLVLLVADRFGQDSAMGFFHSASSLVLFVLALGGMFAISRLAGCRTLAIA